MLKAMRKHAKYFYVLFVIIIISFIFWGVGTDNNSARVPVAEVEKQRITPEEYWIAYDRAREFYRQQFKEKFDETMEKQLKLKEKVLDSLVDERVLLIAADKIGIKVTDEQVQDAIVNDPFFLRDGTFSQEIYEKVLKLNRMTPETFEPMRRRELTIAKMSRLIGESVDLTEADLKQLSGDEQTLNALRQAILRDKRERAIKSYVEGLKKQMKIKLNLQGLSS